MDWADKWTRAALADYRRGAHISGSCVEIYNAVSEALRDAYAQGANAKKPKLPNKE